MKSAYLRHEATLLSKLAFSAKNAEVPFSFFPSKIFSSKFLLFKSPGSIWKKAVLIVLLFINFLPPVSSQGWYNTQGWYKWKWVKGDSIIAQNGIYGTMGVADMPNNPGSRFGAVQWTDAYGKFWLFGGTGYDAFTNAGYLNDLWVYDTLSNQWTWINGNKTVDQTGVYGTKGVSNVNNKPGGRSNAVTWKDAGGMIWIFGGGGFGKLVASSFPGLLNDMWKYNPSTNQWTWIAGNDTVNAKAVYGVKGVPSSSNQPGSRHNAVSWKDNNDNLWFFGGTGYTASSSTSGLLNDLWKFDITTNEWTWISGDSTFSITGVYGTKGISGPANKPGSRRNASMWLDGDDYFWLFGGRGFAESGGSGYLNDLWKYKVSTNEWTWVNGAKQINQAGFHGTKKTGSSNTMPGSRHSAIIWKDPYNGLFWLFGGDAYSLLIGYGYFNDLWYYNVMRNEWTWISGDSTQDKKGIYGVKGTPDSLNKPGSRYGGSSWIDDVSHRLWLFGGDGYGAIGSSGYLNDLWVYQPPASTYLLPVDIISFKGFRVREEIVLEWQSPFPATNSPYDIERSFNGLDFYKIGTVGVPLNTSGENAFYTYKDLKPLPGGNYYRLKQADNGGRIGYSTIIRVQFNKEAKKSLAIEYVSHQHGSLLVHLSSAQAQGVRLYVYDVTGKLITKMPATIETGLNTIPLPIGNVNNGIYILKVENNKQAVSMKFMY